MPDTDPKEANEDVLDAIEDVEDGLSNLKEAVAEHPDAAVRAGLDVEVARIQEIIRKMQASLGWR
jgi:hypothetical protein